MMGIDTRETTASMTRGGGVIPPSRTFTHSSSRAAPASSAAAAASAVSTTASRITRGSGTRQYPGSQHECDQRAERQGAVARVVEPEDEVAPDRRAKGKLALTVEQRHTL